MKLWVEHARDDSNDELTILRFSLISRRVPLRQVSEGQTIHPIKRWWNFSISSSLCSSFHHFCRMKNERIRQSFPLIFPHWHLFDDDRIEQENFKDFIDHLLSIPIFHILNWLTMKEESSRTKKGKISFDGFTSRSRQFIFVKFWKFWFFLSFRSTFEYLADNILNDKLSWVFERWKTRKKRQILIFTNSQLVHNSRFTLERPRLYPSTCWDSNVKLETLRLVQTLTEHWKSKVIRILVREKKLDPIWWLISWENDQGASNHLTAEKFIDCLNLLKIIFFFFEPKEK